MKYKDLKVGDIVYIHRGIGKDYSHSIILDISYFNCSSRQLRIKKYNFFISSSFGKSPLSEGNVGKEQRVNNYKTIYRQGKKIYTGKLFQ